MENRINRAEQLWQAWMEKQGQLEKLIGTGTDSIRELEKTQYDFFRTGLYRISAQPQEHEKLHLQAIALISRKLQKKLYPNPVIRLLHRAKARLFDKPKHLREFETQKVEGLILLNQQFKKLGLASYSGKLDKFLDYESSLVTIPMTTQLPDKSTLDIDVKLARDKSGIYLFNGFGAAMTKPGEMPVKQFFEVGASINAMEAANLLAGRAVKKEFELVDGTRSQKWLQLDFQQQQSPGSFKMLEYHDDFPLEKNLTELMDKVVFEGLKVKEALKGLEQGHQISIGLRNGQYDNVLLQANPADLSISISDKSGQPLSMESLAKKEPDAAHQIERSLSLVRTERIETQQDRSLGIG
ncbi:hypothetical protein SNE26_10250 [Mucilaginibacter sp. cycad4]|uniref:hypothetical protein n=1 Tax=Mucilaginibacter sp. cycad4 TaxID=3342096 RepID=UPI002AAC43BA|nr:hypothetical protein [Mucilaginibacter gossypii]WPV02156.1 hypothetical protein SNE26_10250 [Mucilaginibacter gossypii]